MDSKHYTGKLQHSKGTLWSGRYPLTRKFEALRWEGEQVATAVGRPVRCIMCFVSGELPNAHQELHGVTIVRPEMLIGLITRSEPIDGETVDPGQTLARLAPMMAADRSTLPGPVGVLTPLAPPSPSSPAPAAAPSINTRRRPSGRAPSTPPTRSTGRSTTRSARRPSTAPDGTSPGRAGRRGRRRQSVGEVAVEGVVALVVALFALSWITTSATSTLIGVPPSTTTATTTTTALASTTTAVASVEFG